MHVPEKSLEDIQKTIREVPDFPQPGIGFKDITPLLADSAMFAASIDHLIANFQPGEVDAIVGVDARGFT